MKFIAYMRCSTCVKALKYLNENNVNPEVIDIKTNIPTKEELKQYHELSGLDIKKFFNTSGLVYKELNLKDKLPTMSLEEKYELLSTNGMLIKRPLLISTNSVLLGFKEEEYKKIV
ncbi:MAG: arsenate reductase family protein [bacterium]